MFFNKYIIAISGLQGAGKTNLIEQLYSLPENIFDPNLGTGEIIPILISDVKLQQLGIEFTAEYFMKKCGLRSEDFVYKKGEVAS